MGAWGREHGAWGMGKERVRRKSAGLGRGMGKEAVRRKSAGLGHGMGKERVRRKSAIFGAWRGEKKSAEKDFVLGRGFRRRDVGMTTFTVFNFMPC